MPCIVISNKCRHIPDQNQNQNGLKITRLGLDQSVDALVPRCLADRRVGVLLVSAVAVAAVVAVVVVGRCATASSSESSSELPSYSSCAYNNHQTGQREASKLHTSALKKKTTHQILIAGVLQNCSGPPTMHPQTLKPSIKEFRSSVCVIK